MLCSCKQEEDVIFCLFHPKQNYITLHFFSCRINEWMGLELGGPRSVENVEFPGSGLTIGDKKRTVYPQVKTK